MRSQTIYVQLYLHDHYPQPRRVRDQYLPTDFRMLSAAVAVGGVFLFAFRGSYYSRTRRRPTGVSRADYTERPRANACWCLTPSPCTTHPAGAVLSA